MTTPPTHAATGVPRSVPFDPVRFCVLTTVALIAWIIGPPACVMLMSALGLWAYTKAIRGGLEESRCVLKRPRLILLYLGAAFIAGSAMLVRELLA